MTGFKKGDFVKVQPDTPGKPAHWGVVDSDSKDGLTAVRVRGVPFLIPNSRISRAD